MYVIQTKGKLHFAYFLSSVVEYVPVFIFASLSFGCVEVIGTFSRQTYSGFPQLSRPQKQWSYDAA